MLNRVLFICKLLPFNHVKKHRKNARKGVRKMILSVGIDLFYFVLIVNIIYLFYHLSSLNQKNKINTANLTKAYEKIKKADVTNVKEFAYDLLDSLNTLSQEYSTYLENEDTYLLSLEDEIKLEENILKIIIFGEYLLKTPEIQKDINLYQELDSALETLRKLLLEISPD